MKKKWIFLAPLAILALIGFIALGGLIVEQLWNRLLPPLFGWHGITFWQALGILVLCRILFGGWSGGGRGSHRSKIGGGMRDRMTDHMVNRFAARWESMTPEERERFRQGVRARCGFDPSGPETKPE